MAIRQDREEDLENLLNKGALWAVTYGDLMSYLMIFFLIMFTFTIKGKKSAKDLDALQSHFGGKMKPEVAQRLQQQGQESAVAQELQKKFQAKVTEEKIQVTLNEKVLFDSGNAVVKPEIFSALKEFADEVRALPNTIVIEGHTDNVPIHGKGKYSSNFELSMARAYAVVKYLMDNEGIDPKRLAGIGYGEYRPVVANDTLEHRAQNRRIEINLIRAQ